MMLGFHTSNLCCFDSIEPSAKRVFTASIVISFGLFHILQILKKSIIQLEKQPLQKTTIVNRKSVAH